MIAYYNFVFITLTWVCFSSEEVFNQTESTETLSSKLNLEIKNNTQSATVVSPSTAAYDSIVVDINKIMQNDYNASHKESKIVGGYQSQEGEFPYQASIRGYRGYKASYGHFCGGAIITSIHVLTAAHCMFEVNTDSVYVTIGSYDLLSGDSQSRPVYRVYIHASFDKDTNINDIAIVQVEYPFVLGGLALAIPVANWSHRAAVGTNCTVSGWGRQNEDYMVIPRYLRAVVVPIYDNVACARHYTRASQLPGGMICAGLDSGGKDACQGDSGGPLVCEGYLTGVVSWGNGCARRYYPGVYTDVAFYYDWMAMKTNGFSSATSSYPALLLMMAAVSFYFTVNEHMHLYYVK